MTSDDVQEPRLNRPSSVLGTQQFINPNYIPIEDDMVMLSGAGRLVRILLTVATIAFMLLGIGLIIDGVYGIGAGRAQLLFDTATTPLVGLAVGILATAVIQSSTTTTALTVTAVGVGAVSVPVAIPIIMGANIGTTLTVFIVSFSYLGRRKQFRQAFASAGLHAWFNFLMVVLLLPIELLFQPLQRLSGGLTTSVLDGELNVSETGNFVNAIFQPLIDLLGTRGLFTIIADPVIGAVLCIALGSVMIFGAVRMITAQLRILMAAATRTLLERSSGASDAIGFLTGVSGTMSLQASTVTISSLIPFAAAGSLRLREILSITLGANVGTTLTSLLVALTLPGSMGGFALQAAMVHVLFNVSGTLLVLLIPPFRNLIITLAQQVSQLAGRSYTTAFAALLTSYILLPTGVIALSSLLG